MKMFLVLSMLVLSSMSFAQDDNGVSTHSRPYPGQGGGNPAPNDPRTPTPPKLVLAPKIDVECSIFIGSTASFKSFTSGVENYRNPSLWNEYEVDRYSVKIKVDSYLSKLPTYRISYEVAEGNRFVFKGSSTAKGNENGEFDEAIQVFNEHKEKLQISCYKKPIETTEDKE